MFLQSRASSPEDEDIPQFVSFDLLEQGQRQPSLNVVKKNQTYVKRLGQNNAQYDEPEIQFQNLIYSEDKEIESEVQFPVFEIIDIGEKQEDQVDDQKEDNQDRITPETVQQEEQILEIDIKDLIPSPPVQVYQTPIQNFPLPIYLKPFLINPLPCEGTLQCLLVRINNILNPKYLLFHNGNLLLAAQKRILSSPTRYVISMDEKLEDDILIVGRLQQHKTLEYLGFDGGSKTVNMFDEKRKQLLHMRFDCMESQRKRPRIIQAVTQTHELVSKQPMLKYQFDCTVIPQWQNIYTLSISTDESKQRRSRIVS